MCCFLIQFAELSFCNTARDIITTTVSTHFIRINGVSSKTNNVVLLLDVISVTSTHGLCRLLVTDTHNFRGIINNHVRGVCVHLPHSDVTSCYLVLCEDRFLPQRVVRGRRLPFCQDATGYCTVRTRSMANHPCSFDSYRTSATRSSHVAEIQPLRRFH